MNVAEANHRGGGFWFALVIFAVTPSTPIPRIRALHYPAFPYRKEAFGALWPRLHLDPPARTILGEPVCERMVAIFAVGEDGLQAGNVVNLDLLEQLHRRDAIIH